MERRKVLKALGADLVLTEGSQGMAGSIAKAEEIGGLRSRALRACCSSSRTRPIPEIHFRTTGPEIWEDTDGAVDVLVSGIGTGGTITRRLALHQEGKGQDDSSVGVEPAGSPVITQTLAGQPLKPGPHKIQGIGAGFIPDTLDLSLVDRVELVTNEESIEMARRLAKEEGILAGISCGAAAAVAVRLGKSAGVRRQDHRHGAARRRRAISQHACCSRECSTSRSARNEISGRVWVIGVSAPAVVTGISGH